MSKLDDVLLIDKTRIQQNDEIGSGLIADAEAELAALRARIAALEAVQVAAGEGLAALESCIIYLDQLGASPGLTVTMAKVKKEKLAAALDAAKDASGGNAT